MYVMTTGWCDDVGKANKGRRILFTTVTYRIFLSNSLIHPFALKFFIAQTCTKSYIVSVTTCLHQAQQCEAYAKRHLKCWKRSKWIKGCNG